MSNFNKFWRDFENFLNSTNKLIFRGQANKEWKLLSTFYRHHTFSNFVDLNEDLYNLIMNFEKGLIVLNKKNETSLKDIIQYARHYGLPVPLIDFSYSPYVSLFFACIEEENKDGVLYAIDYVLLFKSLKEFYINKIKTSKLSEFIPLLKYFEDLFAKEQNYSKPIDVRKIFLNEINKLDKKYLLNGKSILDLLILITKLSMVEMELLSKIYFNNLKDENQFKNFITIIFDNPNHIINKKFLKPLKFMIIENDLFFIPYASKNNKKMIYQQGCFIYDTLNYKNLNVSDLEDFIKKYLNKDIIKTLLIPKEHKKNILKRLSLMNINGTNLYRDEYGIVIDSKFGLINAEIKTNIQEYQEAEKYNPYFSNSIEEILDVFESFIK